MVEPCYREKITFLALINLFIKFVILALNLGNLKAILSNRKSMNLSKSSKQVGLLHFQIPIFSKYNVFQYSNAWLG